MFNTRGLLKQQMIILATVALFLLFSATPTFAGLVAGDTGQGGGSGGGSGGGDGGGGIVYGSFQPNYEYMRGWSSGARDWYGRAHEAFTANIRTDGSRDFAGYIVRGNNSGILSHWNVYIVFPVRGDRAMDGSDSTDFLRWESTRVGTNGIALRSWRPEVNGVVASSTYTWMHKWHFYWAGMWNSTALASGAIRPQFLTYENASFRDNHEHGDEVIRSRPLGHNIGYWADRHGNPTLPRLGNTFLHSPEHPDLIDVSGSNAPNATASMSVNMGTIQNMLNKHEGRWALYVYRMDLRDQVLRMQGPDHGDNFREEVRRPRIKVTLTNAITNERVSDGTVMLSVPRAVVNLPARYGEMSLLHGRGTHLEFPADGTIIGQNTRGESFWNGQGPITASVIRNHAMPTLIWQVVNNRMSTAYFLNVRMPEGYVFENRVGDATTTRLRQIGDTGNQTAVDALVYRSQDNSINRHVDKVALGAQTVENKTVVRLWGLIEQTTQTDTGIMFNRVAAGFPSPEATLYHINLLVMPQSSPASIRVNVFRDLNKNGLRDATDQDFHGDIWEYLSPQKPVRMIGSRPASSQHIPLNSLVQNIASNQYSFQATIRSEFRFNNNNPNTFRITGVSRNNSPVIQNSLLGPLDQAYGFQLTPSRNNVININENQRTVINIGITSPEVPKMSIPGPGSPTITAPSVWLDSGRPLTIRAVGVTTSGGVINSNGWRRTPVYIVLYGPTNHDWAAVRPNYVRGGSGIAGTPIEISRKAEGTLAPNSTTLIINYPSDGTGLSWTSPNANRIGGIPSHYSLPSPQNFKSQAEALQNRPTLGLSGTELVSNPDYLFGINYYTFVLYRVDVWTTTGSQTTTDTYYEWGPAAYRNIKIFSTVGSL